MKNKIKTFITITMSAIFAQKTCNIMYKYIYSQTDINNLYSRYRQLIGLHNEIFQRHNYNPKIQHN